MKNLMLVLFVMLAMTVSSEIQAQTTCTPAQVAACKKTCTPEQLAACKAKMASTSTSATAVKVVNQAPEKSTSCAKTSAKTCAKGKVASTTNTPVKLVGLDIIKEEPKKTSCMKTCQKTAMKTEE